MKEYSQELQDAYRAALAVREKAYAPYSKFLVGVALKVEEHEDLFLGCNVENVSYGATICAERVAFFSMVAELKKATPSYLVLVTDTDPAIVPCALCLQVMTEFCSGDFEVYIANLSGIQQKLLFSELLPNPFNHFEVNS